MTVVIRSSVHGAEYSPGTMQDSSTLNLKLGGEEAHGEHHLRAHRWRKCCPENQSGKVRKLGQSLGKRLLRPIFSVM